MHDKRSPVCRFYSDIVDSLTNQKLFKRFDDLINEKKVNKRIRIDVTESAIKTPYCDPQTRELVIQETHMSYLWCIIYSLISIIVINDEQAKLGFTIVEIHKSKEWNVVKALLRWATSLVYEWSEWPKTLPTPEHIADLKIKQSNQVLLDTVRYFAYHEIAHLANGHDNYSGLLTKIKFDPSCATQSELIQLKELEIEADNYAMDCLLLVEDDEQEKYLKLQGAILAHLSNFYLLKTSDTRGYRHPDIDVRLFNILSKIDFENELYTVYSKLTVNTGLQLFLAFMGIPYVDSTGYETFEEQMSALFDLIDNEKLKYAARETKQ